MAEGFRAAVSNENTANSATVSVTIPATVQANDGLVAVWTAAGTGSTAATPAGWTLVAGPIDKGTVLRVYVFKKYADASDAGSSLTVTKSVADATKKQLTVAAYSGVDLSNFIQDFASSVESTAGLTHAIPSVTATGSGNWRAAFVVDRGSPASTGWTPPAALPSERAELIGSGSGTCSTDWADSGGPVSAGTYSGDVFTSASNSTANAITLAFILKPTGGSPATASPGVLSASVTFLAPTVLTGGSVTVIPNLLRMGSGFLPLVGAATAQVIPDSLQAAVAMHSPAGSAVAAALTVPDPLNMSVAFLAPTITNDGTPTNPPPPIFSGLFKFRSPVVIESWPISPGAPLAVKVEVNLTMYRINGVWHSGRNLTFSDLDGADRVYYGGYDVTVPDDELAEMLAQGFDVAVQVDDVGTVDTFLALFTENF